MQTKRFELLRISGRLDTEEELIDQEVVRLEGLGYELMDFNFMPELGTDYFTKWVTMERELPQGKEVP